MLPPPPPNSFFGSFVPLMFLLRPFHVLRKRVTGRPEGKKEGLGRGGRGAVVPVA
jgi:hypothetical protein